MGVTQQQVPHLEQQGIIIKSLESLQIYILPHCSCESSQSPTLLCATPVEQSINDAFANEIYAPNFGILNEDTPTRGNNLCAGFSGSIWLALNHYLY